MLNQTFSCWLIVYLYVLNIFAGFIIVYTNCYLAEKGQVVVFSNLFLFDNIELAQTAGTEESRFKC